MKHPMLEYLKETGACGDRFPTIFCPGCGIGQVLNYTLNAVDHLVEKDGDPAGSFLLRLRDRVLRPGDFPVPRI